MAMNMWDAVLALVALGAFVVVAVLLLQSDTDGRLPWILWGIGLGAALFWAGSKVNDMLVRETSVKRVAEFGSTAAAEAEIQRKAS